MSKFIYRMQNILNIKYKLEDQAKTEFMLANQELREEEEKLQKLKDRKADYEAEVRKLLQNNLQVERIKENQEAIVRMGEFIIAQTTCVEKAQHQVDIKAAKLTEVMQERKAQEKLKEKAFENFLQEENARESKEIDELVSFTYGRRQREE
ncbi:MAG: flagellar export protein FliJ [Lachnospiraceae bacterium]|nr:flagellar export protein FliJ [Lachnospiraceae bacterium]